MRQTQPILQKTTSHLWLGLFSLFIALSVALLIIFAPQVSAATTITVNSTADDQDNDGECTLREAIIASNTDTESGAAAGECDAGSGNDIIEFNIAGVADFTNGGQNGYTIAPASALPDITETVTINGYSQPGASENTTTAPEPFDAIILIELDGSAAGSAFSLVAGSNNSTISGFVINRFEGNAVRFAGTEGSTISGSYIGTDPTGLIARANGTDDVLTSTTISIGEAGAFTDTTTVGNAVGGLTPSARNIISGNYGGGLGVGGVDTIIQGNYFGLGADGVTALGNTLATGAATGNLTLDYDDGTVVGGVDAGAINVISAANTGGIQPYLSTNLTIQGNYIGTDYTGTVAKPNAWDGITFFNTVGINALVGGDSVSAKNVIKFNAQHGIDIDTASNITIKGNEIDSNGENGINVTNETADIVIQDNEVTNSGLAGIHLFQDETLGVSIAGNSIYGNAGLGIDLGVLGVTVNDAGDGDDGPNDYLNYPEYQSIEESSGNTVVTYKLDVPTGNYRVEFFSNSTADPSGNGEGETYLGYDNVSHDGTGKKTFVHTLAGTTGVTNLALTTTERDGSADGFGGTSEFGGELPPDLSVSKTLVNPEDVAPGGTLSYTLSATNIGGEASDLTQFDGTTNGPMASGLFVDLLPPQLSFVDVSSSNPDITCSDFTPTLEAVYFEGILDGLLLNHEAGFTAITCVYTPVSGALAGGDTISTNIDVTVANDATLEWTNYLYGAANGQNDPDANSILTALGVALGSQGTIDLIDQLENSGSNNYTTAQYPVPEDPESVTSLNPANTTEDLAETGRRVVPLVVLSVLVIIAGFTSVILRLRQHQK